MDEEIRDDERRKVTSVGNSWIVCKSKSHSGHVYYFNTLTGEAAWNLSDAEIEKATTRTRTLERQAGGKPKICPEPKDHPPSTISNKSRPSQKPFDEPKRINTVSEKQQTALPFPRFANTDTFHNPVEQISGLGQRPHINSLSREDTIHNTISTLNLNSAAMYNPRVWDVPQVQPVFIAPTLNPIVSHPQAGLSAAFNNLSHTVLQPPSGLFLKTFDNTNQSGNTMRAGTREFLPRHFNYGQGGQNNFNKKNVFTNKNDLRDKLSARNRFSNTPSGTPKVSGVMRTIPKRNDTSAYKACKPEEIHANDLHESSLESRSTDTQLHESPSKIDIGPLRCLAPSDANPDVWFIVVDLDILLNEFKFLNILTDSDENCHLMVPARVMSQLKDYVTHTGNIQARRILRFLSQQIEIGYAFTAEDPSELKGLAEVIHLTCIELSARKYHLILLTNDNEILGIKDTSNIKMFSVNEVKKLLKINSNKQHVSVPKQPFIFERFIKITVPNDTSRKVDTSSTASEIEPGENTEIIPVTETKTKEKHEQNKKEQPIVVKRTVDAGIQTDFDDINTSICTPNVTEKQDLDITNTPQSSKETIIRRPAPSVFNLPDRRREIKLKRSISNQPTVPSAECNEKKQFKWRRRRNTTPQATNNTPQTPAHSNQKTHPKKIENQPPQSPHKEIPKQADTVLNKTPISSRNENKSKEDSIESRESSIIYIDQRNSKENVTIEETSTSGIISNTESNVDADSNYSIGTDNQQLVQSEQTRAKPMYEIESLSMEDYLKMKCDEWVSRFIQVMEEVLSQVLHQDPPFSHSAMPAPWNLHEAAQCVAIKFSSHPDIKDAANRLSNILFRISDAKGKITLNMAPYQYMQMYSYGVHLLSAIANVTSNCEDIQIAVESLKKLLEDIRNPNMDSSANDTFNDNLQDNVSNNGTTNNQDGGSLHEQESLANHNQTETGCSPKSKRRKLNDEEMSKPVEFIRNIDVEESFFSSLKLQRINENETESNGFAQQAQSHQTHSTHSQLEEEHSLNTSLNVEKGTLSDVTTKEQKVIRKFTICAEFEEKLKRKYNTNFYDDELDYEEDCEERDYGEYLTEEYCSEDENDNVQRNDANLNTADMAKGTTDNHSETERPNAVDPIISNENSEKFKYMMCMLLEEIRKALCQVNTLCNQCYEELKNKRGTTVKRCDLKQLAERAHLNILRLCRSLQSMLEQETNHPNQNIRNLLKQADINICDVDDRLLFEYKISVGKCKDHADTFLNSIQNIISAFNN